ncbi:MAG: hypothetical protein Q9172_007040 [Xanthocarpia lactea]
MPWQPEALGLNRIYVTSTSTQLIVFKEREHERTASNASGRFDAGERQRRHWKFGIKLAGTFAENFPWTITTNHRSDHRNGDRWLFCPPFSILLVHFLF